MIGQEEEVAKLLAEAFSAENSTFSSEKIKKRLVSLGTEIDG